MPINGRSSDCGATCLLGILPPLVLGCQSGYPMKAIKPTATEMKGATIPLFLGYF
jgi:hypothetical protein